MPSTSDTKSRLRSPESQQMSRMRELRRLNGFRRVESDLVPEPVHKALIELAQQSGLPAKTMLPQLLAEALRHRGALPSEENFAVSG